jgi:glycogen debranching enzyme
MNAQEMRDSGELACDLPPCLMPFIGEDDEDWLPRYSLYNRPGEYHNGGIWPFIIGFYIAALVAAGREELAAKKMESFSKLVRPARRTELSFGFNEWLRARDCAPAGQDWQTWSAAMYLYAAQCVERGRPLFFETLRD